MALIYYLAAVVIGCLIILVFELISKFLLGRLAHANVVFEEFPKIEESSLSKFSSFDPELGWERQPNEHRKKDVGHQNPDDPDADTVVYSTDEYGSRVCKVDRAENDTNIATYGDSFCFCRDVSDDETIQHHLSKELGVHVSNYGVGNYGLDQSYLRMQRRFDDDPADCIILAFSDKVVINRLVSAWKHYFEFGNTFAVKPRFRLSDGELEKIPCAVKQKTDLLCLEKKASYLRKHDHHYSNWFQDRYMTRPYTKYWVRNRANIPYALITLLEYPFRMSENLSPIHNSLKPIQQKYAVKKIEEEWNYRKELENEFVDLFCQLLGSFSDFAQSRDCKLIMLPIRAARPVDRYPNYSKNYQPINGETKKKIREECPHIQIVDPRKRIVDSVDDISSLYVKQNPVGGHPSPTYNRLNAKYLAEHIGSNLD